MIRSIIPSKRDGAALALMAGATLGAAALGGLATPASSLRTRVWFRTLRKPPFQPPAKVFGPVWSALYSTIALSGYRTFRAPPSIERGRALAWWGAQLGLNGLWSPLFFGWRKPVASLVDSAALLGATTQYVRHARHVDRPAAWMLAPYLGWLAFATVLNAEIVRRN